MAVVVVSILLTAILPMIILSTATRVQARRVDLATQAARGYIDGVRSGVINIVDAPANCAGQTTFPFIDNSQGSQNQYFTDVKVPAPNITTIAKLSCISGVKVDPNNNGFSVNDPQDLVIQPMRSEGTGTTGFYMQVRVYRADAFIQVGADLTGIQPGLILQTGNSEVTCPNARQIVTSTNGSKSCPLVVSGADIYLSANTNTLSQIKSRIK
jgi:type II secretory pathway pseudopilin PulG